MLDANCSFQCPHRHFSHLLEIVDLETTHVHTSDQLDQTIFRSIDNFYGVTCNESNWFNEECRGFTQCGLASMNVVVGRREAAAGNITALVDSVITPNGMYGEMVYFHHPDEFCPVSESAYCGAGSIHTMLMHTNGAGVLQLFPGFPASWGDGVFHKLRAARGLTVSAVRTGGETYWVSLTAATTGNYTFQIADDKRWHNGVATHINGASRSPPKVLPATTPLAKGVGIGMWTVTLQAGVEVVVYQPPPPPPPPTTLHARHNNNNNNTTNTTNSNSFVIAPLAGDASEFNYWGYSHDMHPLH